MKIKICSCCNKIIEKEPHTCVNCGSNYCDNCFKETKNTCNFCGR